MVDRLRISGDSVIREDESTGDVTVDVEALNTERGSVNRLSNGPVQTLTKTGVGQPIDDAQNPAAEYVPGEDSTFMVFRGRDADPHVMEIDHSAETIWGPVKAAESAHLGLTDAHGVPTIAVDDDGIIHIWWDAHNNHIRYVKSSNAYDVTTWDAATDLTGVPEGTYTSPLVYNNDLYVLYRTTGDGGNTHPGDDAYPAHEYATIIRSTDSGSTWTDLGPVIDTTGHPDAESDAYVMDFDVGSDGQLHMSWFVAHGGGHNGTRSDWYHAYYDTSDGNVYDLAGNSYGSTITWSQHSSGVVQALASDLVNTITHHIDGSVVRIIGTDGNTGDVGFAHRLATFSGGSWTTEEIGNGSLRVNAGLSSSTIHKRDDGTFEYHVPANDGSTSNGERGGDWRRYIKDGGTWQFETLVERSDNNYYTVEHIGPVRNGTDKMAAVGSERGFAADSRDLSVYGYGTATPSISATVGARSDPLSQVKGGLTEDIGATIDIFRPYNDDTLRFRHIQDPPSEFRFECNLSRVNEWSFVIGGDGSDRRMSFHQDGSLELPIGGPAPTPTDLTGSTGNRDGEIRTHDGSGTPPFGAAQWDNTNSQWVSLVDGSTFV